MLLCLTLLATTALTACETAHSDVTVCPSITFYTPNFQAGAAKETSLLPSRDASYLRAMLDDYSTLRDTLRACGASYTGTR